MRVEPKLERCESGNMNRLLPLLTPLLDELRAAKGMLSMAMPLDQQLAKIVYDRNYRFYLLHDNVEALGCCAIKHHADYRWLIPNTSITLATSMRMVTSEVNELCTLFIRSGARGRGLAKMMYDFRIAECGNTTMVIGVRHDPDSPTQPSVHPDSLAVVTLALQNGFHQVGLTDDGDYSPVYLKYRSTAP